VGHAGPVPRVSEKSQANPVGSVKKKKKALRGSLGGKRQWGKIVQVGKKFLILRQGNTDGKGEKGLNCSTWEQTRQRIDFGTGVSPRAIGAHKREVSRVKGPGSPQK